MLKIGIIGLGTIAQRHLKACAAEKEVSVTAVCNPTVERARAAAEAIGARAYGDYRELLADPDVDAVIICSPTFTHSEIAIAALKSGKHVLCEKPPALNYEEALANERAARESGKVLMYGFVLRFANYARFLKEYVRAGNLGAIHYAEVSRVSNCSALGGWFRDKKRAGGGGLLDAAIHELDLALDLMGYPKAVSVTGYTNHINSDLPDRVRGFKTAYAPVDNSRIPNTVESFASGLVRFENGAVLTVRAGRIHNTFRTGRSFEISGEKGAAQWDGKTLSLMTVDPTGYFLTSEPHLKDEQQDLFREEIAHFADCCLGKATCICPPAQGAEVMKIISGIYRSAETGKEIVF